MILARLVVILSARDAESATMANLNKVFLIGNLTADPELRYIPATGTPVADLRMAINRSWASRDGERREEVLYIDVTVWDRMAENCCKYLKRGRPIHVEGYLKLETWESNGEKRSKIKVVADNVQFLDRGDRPGGDSGGSGIDEGYGPPPAPRASSRYSGAPRDAAPNGPPPRGGGGSYDGGGPPPSRPARPTPPPAHDDDGDDIPF